MVEKGDLKGEFSGDYGGGSIIGGDIKEFVEITGGDGRLREIMVEVTVVEMVVMEMGLRRKFHVGVGDVEMSFGGGRDRIQEGGDAGG